MVDIPQSRVEKILHSMRGESVQLEPPQSRVEEDLLKLKDAIDTGGSGTPITIDSELDPSSTNPIANKAILKAITNDYEESSTASKEHKAGDLFFYDGEICKAKVDIDVNDTLVLNTNYEITSIDELFNGNNDDLRQYVDNNTQVLTVEEVNSICT